MNYKKPRNCLFLTSSHLIWKRPNTWICKISWCLSCETYMKYTENRISNIPVHGCRIGEWLGALDLPAPFLMLWILCGNILLWTSWNIEKTMVLLTYHLPNVWNKYLLTRNLWYYKMIISSAILRFPQSYLSWVLKVVQIWIYLSSFAYSMSGNTVHCIDCTMLLSAEKQIFFCSFGNKI